MRKPIHQRQGTGRPPSPEAVAARANAAVATTVTAPQAASAAPLASVAPPSFAIDIRPMFAPFAAVMMWRFDLTDYNAVVANAKRILERISDPGAPMPPPPFPMLTAAQIQLFQDWMTGSCQP